MFCRTIISAVALSLLTLPALAATDYWVATSASTKKCEVVDKKPDGKTMMEVGMVHYKTKAEAETAMKASAHCK